jgi:ubiquinone/menaquinone biosynthesis C-methylase UbiE
MTQPNDAQGQAENTYLIDAESALEMARLLDQDRVMTRGMGGVFPEQEDAHLPGVTRILDVACGPGGWVNEVAQHYPHIDVTGIDISKNTINYAKAHAQVRKLNNAHFVVMNALKPLDFPDASFDIVNMRTIVGFVPPSQWISYLTECKRVLRPGGILRLTEGEYGFTNKPAHERFMALLNEAQYKAGRSFSPTGHNAGMIAMLRPLLKQVGLQNIQSKAHIIDYSFGMEAYEEGIEDIKFVLELAQPLLFSTKVITPEAFAEMHTQVLEEVQGEDFSGVTILLTVWGEKP